MPDFNRMQRQRYARELSALDLLPESRRTDTLTHYGIKGQKWGIRRYQNENGTLTDAGKKRYSAIGIKMDLSRARRQARKENVKGRVKGSTGANYDKALKERKKAYEYLDDELEKVHQRDKKAKTEKEVYKNWADYEKVMRKTLDKADRFVVEAMLKDAGYSDQDVKAGYEWLQNNASYFGFMMPSYYYGK